MKLIFYPARFPKQELQVRARCDGWVAEVFKTLAVLMSLAVLAPSTILAAPTSTWSGNDGNRIWNDANNWDVIPVAGANLVFPALVPSSTVTNTIDNFPNGTGFNSLTLATNYFVSGNSITLTNGIISASPSVTINNVITLGASQTFTNTAGTLTFTGTITNKNYNLTFRGGATIVVSSIVSSNGSITVDGGKLVVTAAQGISTNVPILTLTNNPVLDITAVNLVLAGGQTLKGGGSVIGNLTDNGTLSPGFGIGTMNFSNALALGGSATNIMEINKTGATLTNDLVNVGGTLTYGGTLTVTATGNALAAGDGFQLFTAGNYTGGFGVFNLPPLGAGLIWTNTLSTDGRLAVVSGTNPPVVTPA